jgi:RHS repeat-associated protein
VVLGDQVYGPYGNRRVQQGTISTSKGFTGQFTDFVAGLDYYGARFYDPVVGVFVSADVVQGNAQGMNPYGYVGGNPETKTDPSGNLRYDPATGQVAIPQPNGSYVITGYNTGLNGTFDSSVSSTPVVFNPSSFWPKSTPVGTSIHHVSHPKFDFGTVQGRRACYQNAACSDAMHQEAADRLKEAALQAAGWAIFGIDLLSTLVDNMYGPEEAELQYERNLEEAQLTEEEDQATLEE